MENAKYQNCKKLCPEEVWGPKLRNTNRNIAEVVPPDPLRTPILYNVDTVLLFFYFTKPYKFIGFGAIAITEPYKFIGFGAIAITKPYKFIGFGDLSGGSPRYKSDPPPYPGVPGYARSAR